MEGLGAYGNLMCLTESFMSDWSVGLIIDRLECIEAEIETGFS